MRLRILFALVAAIVMSASAQAAGQFVTDEQTGIEELNSFAPGIEEFLHKFDQFYDIEKGLSPFPSGQGDELSAAGCYQAECAIYVDVDKASQTLRLYLEGRLADQWLVSTGRPGFDTPDFNQRFNGRIFQRFDSAKYPGGDYMGLGNMPYAMFISGGFAVHGTPEANWPILGRAASHGCIRILPENAKYLNGLLRGAGVQNSWVTVH
jgi:lipoprotein-anchoring transpeptidase ErfK/SrfK